MRYAPSRPFPAYAFLPGRDPHPTRDPRGHSYGSEPEAPRARVRPEAWRESEEYLYGVDLYNHGYLWEAHEAWEELWHPAKADPVLADFLQGLIQCAAACLKIPMGQPAGSVKLAELGVKKLERVAGEVGPRFMGLELLTFAESVRSFVASDPETIDARPRLVLDPSEK